MKTEKGLNPSDALVRSCVETRPLPLAGVAFAMVFMCMALAGAWWLWHTPEMADQHLPRSKTHLGSEAATRDPFRLAGCVEAAGSGTVEAVAPCPPAPDFLKTPEWAPVKAVLDSFVAPKRGASPNMAIVASHGGAVGLHQGRIAHLSINLTMQQKLQALTDCYTGGGVEQCDRASVRPTGMDFLGGERARSVGLVLMDQTGSILAATSSLGLCTRSGGPDCPKDISSRPEWARSHQAMFHTAFLGSTVKVPMALGLLQSGLTAREREALPSILARSKTKEMLDLVFCKEAGFEPVCYLKRLGRLKEAGRRFSSGKEVELMGGTSLTAGLMNLPVPGLQILSLPFKDELGSQQERVRDCAVRHYVKCKGVVLNHMLSELYGTSHQASPVALGGGFLSLLAANWKQDKSRVSPRLIESAQTSEGFLQPSTRSQGLLPPSLNGDADTVLSAMRNTVTEGSAHAACLSAKTLSSAPWSIACNRQLPARQKTALSTAVEADRPPFVASKTGTPQFSHDTLTDTQRFMACDKARHSLALLDKRSHRWPAANNHMLSLCQMRPYKWFVAAIGPLVDGNPSHVIAVLAERNYLRQSRQLDSVDDRGVNVAAEIGLLATNLFFQPRS